MKILICGAGPVGTGIARQLASEDHQVTVVDTQEKNLQKISESTDVYTYFGVPSYPHVLQDAGIVDAEMVIAVTTSDEVNMIICQIAHSLFDVPIKIARIRNQSYLLPTWSDLYRDDHLPIDYIISPEKEVAEAIINRLHVPGAMDSIPLGNGSVLVTEVRCNENCPLINFSIEDIYQQFPDLNMVFMAISRDQEFILPELNEQLQVGDEIFFLAPKENVRKAMAMLGHEEQEARRIVIVGGGNIGLFISESLEKEESPPNVKLIELNSERAEYVASCLKGTTVLNGSALEKEVLSEANIESAEAVISVTNDDEVNILSSMLSKRYGAGATFALVNKGKSYQPLISTLGIDVIVNPREVTVSSILQHARKGKVRSANSICNGEAELFEIEVMSNALVIGKSIKDIDLPDGVRIYGIIRKDKMVASTSDVVLMEADRVVILSLPSKVSSLDSIFSESMDYF